MSTVSNAGSFLVRRASFAATCVAWTCFAACGTSSKPATKDAAAETGTAKDAARDANDAAGDTTTTDASNASDTSDAPTATDTGADTTNAGSDGASLTTVYDLKADWSDTANPNGSWSYNEGVNPLPHVASWLGGSAHAGSPAQPGWARDPGADFGAPNAFLPVFFKSGGFQTWTPAPTWAATGDVIIHTTDDADGMGSGAAILRWKSPSAGTISVAGGVWMGVLAGRSNDWSLTLNGVRLAGGSLTSGDAYTRATPFSFSSGVDGGAGLEGLHVAAGDVLSLVLTKTSTYGYFVDVTETITLVSATAPSPSDGGSQ